MLHTICSMIRSAGEAETQSGAGSSPAVASNDSPLPAG